MHMKDADVYYNVLPIKKKPKTLTHKVHTEDYLISLEKKKSKKQ